jgi:hypothetical protein
LAGIEVDLMVWQMMWAPSVCHLQPAHHHRQIRVRQGIFEVVECSVEVVEQAVTVAEVVSAKEKMSFDDVEFGSP